MQFPKGSLFTQSVLARSRSLVRYNLPASRVLGSTASKIRVNASTFPPFRPSTYRFLASASAADASTESTSSSSSQKSTEKKEKTESSNIFLDNMGTIFLSVIGLIIASLVRSFLGTTNRNKLRDSVEDQAELDPGEIDDLRLANSELTVSVFRQIKADIAADWAGRSSFTYDDFVTAVRRSMARQKGEAFTIQLGHLMDRIVLSALQERGKSSTDELPLTFWWTALSLALHAPVAERIHVLYEALQEESDDHVTLESVVQMVQNLQDTCQLVPESQIVATERYIPVQQFEKGKAEQLVPWDGSQRDRVDVDAFAEILRSKAVCAWGECYHKKKVV